MDTRVDAHSEQWYKTRVGRFTASRLYDLISKAKLNPRPYVVEKAAETLTGESQDSDYFDENMAHGVEYENLAIKWFSKKTGIEVKENSEFVKHQYLNFGATPDRVGMDENGNRIILEVKCPKTTNHIRNCLMNDVEDFKSKHPKYYWQIIGGAICEGATKGAFISFDPRIDADCGLYVLMFDIPERDIDTAIRAIQTAQDEMQDLINTLKS